MRGNIIVQLITDFISMVTAAYFSPNGANLCACVHTGACMYVCMYMDT